MSERPEEYREPQETGYDDSHLQSPEYRKRLKRKLNTLIAVLEVACAKVRRSLDGPDPDVERLSRIHKNLRDTLRVCNRARTALERHEALPSDLPQHLRLAGQQSFAPDAAEVRGSDVELDGEEERRKFAKLGPIDPREVRSCNLDDLCQRLLGA